MRVYLSVVAAIASALCSGQAHSYNIASAITYTIGSETLEGYSRTWKDPADTDHYLCVSWAWDDWYGYQCTAVISYINHVYAGGTLTSPTASTEGGYTTAYADASAAFSKTVPAVPPGIWTVDGDHKVFTEIYYQDCYGGYCSYPIYMGTYWYDIGTTSGQAAVCASHQSVIDYAVIGVLSGDWPSSEPWERGVMARCGGDDVILFGYYNDSFGQFYAGAVFNDPCKSSAGVVAADRAAGAHSHPFFANTTQYNRGNGCFDDTDPISNQDRQDLNARNQNFSDNDKIAIFASGEKPLYLKTPTGAQIKRLDTSTGSAITVYP